MPKEKGRYGVLARYTVHGCWIRWMRRMLSSGLEYLNSPEQ